MATGMRRPKVNFCSVPDEELIEASPFYRAIAMASRKGLGRDSLTTDQWKEFRSKLKPCWHDVDINSIHRRVTSLAKNKNHRHHFTLGLGHGPRKAPDYKVPPEWESYLDTPEFRRKEKDTLLQRQGKCTVCTRIDDVKMHIIEWSKVPNEPSSHRILLCWRCRRRLLSDLCPECEKLFANGDDPSGDGDPKADLEELESVVEEDALMNAEDGF